MRGMFVYSIVTLPCTGVVAVGTHSPAAHSSRSSRWLPRTSTANCAANSHPIYDTDVDCFMLTSASIARLGTR